MEKKEEQVRTENQDDLRGETRPDPAQEYDTAWQDGDEGKEDERQEAEPEVKPEEKPSDDQAKAEDDPAALLKAENERLKAQLAELAAARLLPSPRGLEPGTAAIGQKKAVPERQEDTPVESAVELLAEDKLGDEFQRLKQLDPHIARLAREKSAMGKGIRDRLDAFGAEDALTYAAPLLEIRRATDAHRQEAARIEENRRKQYAEDFQSQICAADPDFKLAMESGSGAAYLQKIRDWAGSKSYAEGKRIFEVIEGGSIQDSIAVLGQYRSEISGREKDRTKAAAEAMAAVPGKQQPHGLNPRGRKSDYDSAWDEDEK